MSNADTPHSDRQMTAESGLAALVNNAAAVASLAATVAGTLGPKGLNCMLVDRFGESVITNDGTTILERVEVNHPAAQLVIKAARAQEKLVGDGSTTTTVLAGALIAAGLERIRQGVPVTRLAEGITFGVQQAISYLKQLALPVNSLSDPALRQTALIAARGDSILTDLALQAAQHIPLERLSDVESFRLSDHIIDCEHPGDEVIPGIVLHKLPLGAACDLLDMPVRIMVLDDTLEPEPVEPAALATEAGFQRHLTAQEHFLADLKILIIADVKAIFIHRGVSPQAEQLMAQAGIMLFRRLSDLEIQSIAQHTGATSLRRTDISRLVNEADALCGQADSIILKKSADLTCITSSHGQPAVTVIIGAATPEVRAERRRMIQDATSAIQAALPGGIIPGGGAAEIAVARHLDTQRIKKSGIEAYGLDCVVEALKKPLSQIITNAGFNALEGLAAVTSAQNTSGSPSMGFDCTSGQVVDFYNVGVYDPLLVKVSALQTAAEIALAILRVNLVIRARNFNEEA